MACTRLALAARAKAVLQQQLLPYSNQRSQLLKLLLKDGNESAVWFSLLHKGQIAKRSHRARKQKQNTATLTLDTTVLSTNLKIPNHHQASRVGATCDKGCCVHPGGLSLL